MPPRENFLKELPRIYRKIIKVKKKEKKLRTIGFEPEILPTSRTELSTTDGAQSQNM